MVSDSDLQENQQETFVAEEELEEQDSNLEQQKQQEWPQEQQQQLPQKRKMNMYDYLTVKLQRKVGIEINLGKTISIWQDRCFVCHWQDSFKVFKCR